MFIFYFFFVQPVGWWYTDYLKFKYNIASAPFFCPYHTTYITVRYASYLRFLSGFIFQVPALFSRFRLYFPGSIGFRLFSRFFFTHTWTPGHRTADLPPACRRPARETTPFLPSRHAHQSLTHQPTKEKKDKRPSHHYSSS